MKKLLLEIHEEEVVEPEVSSIQNEHSTFFESSALTLVEGTTEIEKIAENKQKLSEIAQSDEKLESITTVTEDKGNDRIPKIPCSHKDIANIIETIKRRGYATNSESAKEIEKLFKVFQGNNWSSETEEHGKKLSLVNETDETKLENLQKLNRIRNLTMDIRELEGCNEGGRWRKR